MARGILQGKVEAIWTISFKIRAKIEVREHCVSLRRRVYTMVRHFENREGYWVSCGKLRTYSQHRDIVATPSQKAVATKIIDKVHHQNNAGVFNFRHGTRRDTTVGNNIIQ